MSPLSGVLGEAWQLYRAHTAHLLMIAFVIYLPAAIVAALFALTGHVTGALFRNVVELLAAFVLQAVLVKVVQGARDGRTDLSFSRTVSAAAPYFWPVAGVSILAGIAISIGLILLVIPGLYLITIWAVIVPVIVIEQSPALASFGRSRQLVRGTGWNVFGTLVLMLLILSVVGTALELIFSALPVLVRSGLSTVVLGTLVAPFLALVVTLIYYRLADAGSGRQGPVDGYIQAE
jgi:hypothetical protein